MAYKDLSHPPNARFTGEEPTTGIDIGPAGISVSLDAWGPQEHLFTTLYDTSTATWGNEPTRSGLQICRCSEEGRRAVHQSIESWEHKTGWCRLTDAQREFLHNAFSGGTLQQDLEGISLWFTINGVSRAFTHEFVRTRLGAAFKQHGGRDNDWRHRRWTMTEAIDRACKACEWRGRELPQDVTVRFDPQDHRDLREHETVLPPMPNPNGERHHCIVDWNPIDRLIDAWTDHVDASSPSLRSVIENHVQSAKALYAALVDAGVPWQDARRVLPIGLQTYVHGIYNFVGFRGAAANRLEFIMDWEINCVFQLMLREIKMKCPPLLSMYLGSHSDRLQKAAFDQLQLCPPDGKFPSLTIVCKTCGHSEGNHHPDQDVNVMPGVVRQADPEMRCCEACERDGKRHIARHRFVPHDTLPRVFRREQQPFFVLHPDSMNGGPVKWLWTNGHYQDIKRQLEAE